MFFSGKWTRLFFVVVSGSLVSACFGSDPSLKSFEEELVLLNEAAFDCESHRTEALGQINSVMCHGDGLSWTIFRNPLSPSEFEIHLSWTNPGEPSKMAEYLQSRGVTDEDFLRYVSTNANYIRPSVETSSTKLFYEYNAHWDYEFKLSITMK